MVIPRPAQPGPAIDVRALSKLHGPTAALMDVTFSIEPGDMVAVLGAPGTGKTTLLKLLAGHVTPTGGRIRVCGIDVRTARVALTEKIGYVSQHMGDRGNMSPRDLLEFGGRARQIPPRMLNRRIEDVVAICELDGEFHAPCERLDADGRGRVALARALLHEPSVLLLDGLLAEPDEAGMLGTLRILRRLRGATTLLVTGPARMLSVLPANRALLLDGGRLTFDGRATDMSPDAPDDPR